MCKRDNEPTIRVQLLIHYNQSQVYSYRQKGFAMFKLTRSYVRYAFSMLSVVGFALSLN